MYLDDDSIRPVVGFSMSEKMVAKTIPNFVEALEAEPIIF
jgi:hypothetical protein